MRFWDASAILPLAVEEPRSAIARKLLDADPVVAVWWLTRTECLSAVARRARDRSLSESAARDVRGVLRTIGASWSEVQPTERVRASAERLLTVHDLRTGDALQLAAALDWCDGTTHDATVVCLDSRLRGAALREGFTVLPDID